MTALPVPVPGYDLDELDPDALEHDEKRALAWSLVMRGWTKKDAAVRCGVSRQTLTKWIDQEARRRRSLVRSVDAEAEKAIGQIEAVVAEAWESHRRLAESEKGTNAMVGPQYLRLVIDGVKEIARWRGLERPGESGPARKHVEVVVRIGGATPSAPVIDVQAVEDDDDGDGEAS